jgi:hypothetical protein
VSGPTAGALATFQDPNLSLVRTIYGIAEEYEERTYLSVIAELNAYPTQVEGQYFTPEWDQRWYTIKVNADESIFMPLYFEDQYQEDGRLIVYMLGRLITMTQKRTMKHWVIIFLLTTRCFDW